MSLTPITLVFIHKIIFIQGSSAVEKVLTKGGNLASFPGSLFPLPQESLGTRLGGNCAHAATHYEF